MPSLFHRPLLVLLPLLLSACATPAPASPNQTSAPLGIDLGPAGPVMASAQTAAPTQAAVAGESKTRTHGAMQMAHDGKNDVHATGTVNSVDPAQHKVNLTHQPIPEIGWPTMTMDFAVAPSVDLRAVKPGGHVQFMMERGPDGMYQIQSIAPAGAAR
jgi:Cu/Ag efflux protein CusF